MKEENVIIKGRYQVTALILMHHTITYLVMKNTSCYGSGGLSCNFRDFIALINFEFEHISIHSIEVNTIIGS